MLQVIFPEALVHSSIDMRINAKAICFVVSPLAFVSVTIDMCELSLAIGLVVYPASCIACAIWPPLRALTISKASLPFTLINRTSLKSVQFSDLSCLIAVFLVTSDSFFEFSECEIPR